MDLKKQESKSTYGSIEAKEPQVVKDGGENNSTSSKSKTWLWIVILLILAVIVYFAVRSCVSPPLTDEGEASSKDEQEEVMDDEAGTAETIVADAESNADTQAETYSVPKIEESSNAGSANTAYEQVDIETTAINVIRGDYGNGQERKDKLGSTYADVQKRVNEMYRQGIVE